MALNDHPSQWVWAGFASIAGAVSALSFRPFMQMTKGEIAMALVVGTTFAFFVGPLTVWFIFGSGPADMRITGAIFYLMATGSNALIPRAVRWLGRAFGEKDESK